MLETGVQVRLCREQHDVLEVSVVYVSIHPEESLEYDFDNVHKVFWEGHSQLAWEYFFVVELVFDPGHQKVDVLCSADFEGRLDVVTISPEVLVLGACRHGGAGLGSTELSQNSVEHVDLVVELNGVHC